MQFPCRSSISTVLLILSCLNCFSTKVSSIDTLRQEPDNLNSSSQLVSANGDFTLGFYTPPNTTNTYLALWLTNPSYFNLVWIANRDNPIPSNASPVLRIGTGCQMTITLDDDVEPIELYGGGSRDRNVTATLLDSGNFVLKSNDSSGDLLWQSFDHPTDTLLPGMKIGVNYRTGRNWKLCSWLGSSNPVSGPFTLEWNPAARNLVFRQRESVYWRGGELKYYYDEFGKARVDFEFFNFRNDAENFYFNFTRITNDDEDYLVFSLVPIPNSNKKVVSGWKLNYEGDIYDIDRSVAVARPSVCLNYYTDESAASRACQKQRNCRDERQRFVLKSGDFRPQAEQFHDRNPSLSLNDCMQACWSNCKCVAYAGGNGTGCYAWRGKNLEFVPSDNASSSAQMYVLEMRPSSSKGMKKQMIVIILVVVGSVVLLILVITLFVLRKRRLGKRDEQLHDLLTLDGYTETYELENGGGKAHDLKLFSYASISSATNGFSSENILGQGGFGPVYKGKTSEGQDIAVKLLSRKSGQGIVELKTELILISKLQHVNLVKLIGCCIHGDDKMIVYEYMHNRSLDSFLFDPSKREQLDWPKRFNIIEGTAQGLLYLHKYSRLKIIHRDLKPNNILLDQNMNPKISDFGLARIFKQNDVEANTKRCYGTYGYMAPEYGMQGIFSVKSDVYSFGVLVLEIVGGRKNNSFHQMEGPVNLVEYAWDLWCKDSSVELMDPTFRNSCVMEQVQRCIHIGLLCVEYHAVDRPTIEDVISMLRNETKDLAMPKSPAFITRNSVFEEASANEVTVSILQGR